MEHGAQCLQAQHEPWEARDDADDCRERLEMVRVVAQLEQGGLGGQIELFAPGPDTVGHDMHEQDREQAVGQHVVADDAGACGEPAESREHRAWIPGVQKRHGLVAGAKGAPADGIVGEVAVPDEGTLQDEDDDRKKGGECAEGNQHVRDPVGSVRGTEAGYRPGIGRRRISSFDPVGEEDARGDECSGRAEVDQGGRDAGEAGVTVGDSPVQGWQERDQRVGQKPQGYEGP